MRKQYPPTFKAKVALELLKEEKTLNEIASQYGVHANQVRQWRQHVLDGLPGLFSRERPASQTEVKKLEETVTELYAEIGRLTTELGWLKKKGGH